MEYKEKREVMSIITSESCFTDEQISIIERSLRKDDFENCTILDLNAINLLEEKGFLRDFHNVCKKNALFPKWLDNVEKGIDHV